MSRANDGYDGAIAHGSSATGGSPAAASGPDAALDAVLDAVESDCRAGRPVDLEALVRLHPRLEADLRPAVEAILAMNWCPTGSTAARQAAARVGAPREVLEGNRRLGDFRLIREIGRGGMGVVYEAEQVSLGRRVALKVLPMVGLLDERVLQRFRNEARAAASLHHPHVVPVHGVGCERGVHHLAMQLIDGPPLSDVIRDARARAGIESTDRRDSSGGGSALLGSVTPQAAGSDPPAATVVAGQAAAAPSGDFRIARRLPASAPSPELSESSKGRYRAAAKLIRQAAEGLEYAHSLGVIHRDVKPSNLLLDRRGDVWVADFGLAHLEGDAALTMTGDLLGTLRYMSPEQATGRRGLVDHRSDVYSLGLTLYELLTLRPAFPQTHRVDLMKAVAEAEPARPRRLDPRVPWDLETVVLKATERDPAKRYQTARALADDLGRFLDGEHVLAKRPRLSDRAGRWVWRHRAVTAASGLGLLLVTAAAGAASYRQNAAVAALTVAAREDLAAAKAAFAAGDLALTGQELAELRSRQPAAELLAEAGKLGNEADRYRRFMKVADEARGHWDEAMRRNATAALAVYAVGDREHWLDELRASSLPPTRLAEVERAVYELLILLADDELRWHRGTVAARRALTRLADAAAVREPTRAVFYLRAKANELLGYEEGDGGARSASAPATIALDEFLLGRDANWAGHEFGPPRRDRTEAVRRYRAALRLDPRHYPSLFFLAYHNDSPEQALGVYAGCAAVDPGHDVLYINRAQLYHKLGEHEEAAAEYRVVAENLRRTLSDGPGDWYQWDHLRLALLESGQLAAAVNAAEAGLKWFPDNAQLAAQTAVLHATCHDERLRDPARARQIAARQEELGGRNSARSLEAAAIYALLGDAEAGRRLTKAALERFRSDGEKADEPARIAVLFPGTADAREVVRTAESAVAEEANLPGGPPPWRLYALGLARFRAGDLAGAEAALRDGIAKPDWRPQALNWLGLALVLEAKGERAEAKLWLAKADDWLEEQRLDVFWLVPPHDWLSCLALRQEAVRLLGEPLPAVPVEAPRPDNIGPL